MKGSIVYVALLVTWIGVIMVDVAASESIGNRDEPVRNSSGNQDCVCIPYYHCNQNQTINQDGVGIIDVRTTECEDSFEVCCYPTAIASTTLATPTIVDQSSSTCTCVPENKCKPKQDGVQDLYRYQSCEKDHICCSDEDMIRESSAMLEEIQTTTSYDDEPVRNSSSKPHCVCVPNYSCNQNQTVNQGGAGIMDVRTTQCDNGFEVCCYPTAIVSTTLASPSAVDTSSSTCTCVPENRCKPKQDGVQDLYRSQNCEKGHICCSDMDMLTEYSTVPEEIHPTITYEGFSDFGSSAHGTCKCVKYMFCNDNESEEQDKESLNVSQQSCVFPEVCCFNVSTEMNLLPTPVLVDPKRNSSNPECGIRNYGGVGSAQERVQGGYESEFGEFPWMVILLTRVRDETGSGFLYRCGGSLIHPSVVLTAAHCVRGRAELYIRVGEWDTNSSEPLDPQTRRVKQVIVHENYKNRGLHNDIALLILDTPVDLSPHVGLICLPEQNENSDDRECVATGWGKNSFDNEAEYQTVMKKIDLPTVRRAQCLETLRQSVLRRGFQLHESFICAGGKVGKDTCTGDGGSPLACPDRSDPRLYVQTGIVSWGIGCGNVIPSVYVDVAKFRDWIDTKLGVFSFKLPSH